MARRDWFVLASVISAACGSSKEDPVRAVVQDNLATDLGTIEGTRTSNTPHWQAVQDLCADRFASLGFTVERQAYGTGTNVIGVLEGTSAPAEQVAISAHYDSVPNCPGADDNGSGVAGVLEAARVLAASPHARTLVVACWDEEEKGLIGSSAFVARAAAAGQHFVASFVFEMIGYKNTAPNSQMSDAYIAAIFPDAQAQLEANQFRGDFLLVIHDTPRADAAAADLIKTAGDVGLSTVELAVLDGLKTNSAAGALRRSDHAPFWDVDEPALQLTDTADYRNPHYHCQGGPDAVADLDLGFATQVVQATVGAAAAALDR
jgi:Zn-dependent M28 family amino/carboxypeptidase